MLSDVRMTMLWVMAVLASALPTQAGAVSVTVHPLTTEVALGGTATLEIVVSDLGPDVVGGYSLTLNHDPSALAPISIAFGAALGQVGVQQLFTPVPALPQATPGVIALTSVSLLSTGQLEALQSEPVILLMIQFEALEAGVALLSLSGLAISDGLGNPLMISEAQDGVITVVPEPGTFACLSAGLFLLGLLRRR
jgi:hypothetical protein